MDADLPPCPSQAVDSETSRPVKKLRDPGLFRPQRVYVLLSTAINFKVLDCSACHHYCIPFTIPLSYEVWSLRAAAFQFPAAPSTWCAPPTWCHHFRFFSSKPAQSVLRMARYSSFRSFEASIDSLGSGQVHLPNVGCQLPAQQQAEADVTDAYRWK